MSGPPAWLRLYERLDAGLNRGLLTARGAFDGVWLGLLDEQRLAVLDQRHYDGQGEYADDAYNTGGLQPWEARLVAAHFPPGARVAVVGAGGGREVLALLEAGYDAVGYEPHPGLAAAGARLLAERGRPGRLHACARSGWPAGAEAFDAVLVGWGAYMLVPSRRARVALLAAASAATGGTGPVALSYFEMTQPLHRFRAARRVAAPLRALRRAEPVLLGDALSPNYVHCFSGRQVDDEVTAAGLAVIERGSDGYGWAVGRGSATRGASHGRAGG